MVSWHSSFLEIGLFPPPVNVSISSSVAAHARSRIVNIVSDMTLRQKMKAALNLGTSIELALVRDFENLMKKWKFRWLFGDNCNHVFLVVMTSLI